MRPFEGGRQSRVVDQCLAGVDEADATCCKICREVFPNLLFQRRGSGMVGIRDREKEVGDGGGEADGKVEKVVVGIGRSQGLHWEMRRAFLAPLSEVFNPCL